MGCFLAVAFLLLGLSSPKNVSEKEKMCDKVYLKEKQKAEIFKLINDGGSKKEVEKLYFALTKTALMPEEMDDIEELAKFVAQIDLSFDWPFEG